MKSQHNAKSWRASPRPSAAALRAVLTTRRAGVVAAVIAALVAATFTVPTAAFAATDPCGLGGNAVSCENSKPGNAPDEWDISGAGDPDIQGFATTMSVQPGETVKFKIKATTSYTVDVYRLGYYQGLGARRQAPTWAVSSPVNQPPCATDQSTHNYDCGTWAVSTQWQVPSSAVSGVYVANLAMGNSYSHITFIVRGDNTNSDVVFKTSDATWQAYNEYGGASFYTAPYALTGTQARAFKISYNRPFQTRSRELGRDFLFSNEYPTLRFLEANGYDVSYTTDVDVSTGTTVLTNHKTFLSVGHDEYWTLDERNKVEAARDAGVNMAFLSGNEAYWHTTFAASIDGTNTANRTIVGYKDSWDPSQINPSGEATPTWRDPAYAAPNGSRPENSLTGTMYMSNFTDLAITVSAAQGKARLWRHTNLASLPAGGSAQLAPHSIGYESDEDVDNGFRPAGLMRLSETTGPTGQKVQNPAGTTVAPGTTTHSLTLYRASSGALVFGAGTINWGWGLDQYHDGDNSNPPDSRMQQATLNILADMGTLPATLRPGLTMPSAGTDTQAPTTTITTPAAGATLGNGTAVTITGTAADTGGGVVTAVEVSTDGGASYRRATGTTSWSFTGTLTGVGATSIKVRATDDSANLGNPASVAMTVACPCSLFGATVPKTAATTDVSNVEVGVKFSADSDGFISGIRFYKGAGNTGTHTGTLWSETGAPLASGVFLGETAGGWQTLTFLAPVPVAAGQTYVASYNAPNGRYAADQDFFAADWKAAPLKAPGSASSVGNGVFREGRGFPSTSYKSTNYWVDVVFARDDTTPPSVATTNPVANSSSVASTVTPSALFAASVNPTTVVMTLKDAQNNTVPGATSFDILRRTAKFTPSAPLNNSASYTASVRASSAGGVAMPAPYVWTFTVSATDPLPGICPCSIWSDLDLPLVANTLDADSVQVGTKFTADVDGTVTAVKFYKGPLNVGSHTGSVWTSTGTLLGSVSFSNETAAGWQTAYFTTPVSITADTTYIVSYTAPNGGYAVSASGLATPVDSGPLHTLATGGVYNYGAGAPLATSTSNYWVDVIFQASDAAPLITRTTPSDTATNVAISAKPSATLAGLVQPGTGAITLKTSAGAAVAGASSYNSSTRTFTFTPTSPLTEGAGYTARVADAVALSGYAMTPYEFSFTTAGISACPCTLFESSAQPATAAVNDGDAVELGVAFTPSADGQVTGVRFYKGATNIGAHVGSLWSSTGTRLATGTFTGETSSGWQTLTFGTGVAVTSGTSYVVSYHAPNGRYSATNDYFGSTVTNGPLSAGAPNGRYGYGSTSSFPSSTSNGTNYWVDPIFAPGTPVDVAAPLVSTVTPVTGSTNRAAESKPTATFNEDVDPGSVVMGLTGPGGVTVAGVSSLSGRTATFTPGARLADGAVYTVSVQAADVAGNAMATATTWSFTTAPLQNCPCTVLGGSGTPAQLSVTDSGTGGIELGMAFSARTDGRVTGVRFYKGAGNDGTHTGSLWSAGGALLATTTFTDEQSSGWQSATFSTPVDIVANTTYVISYRSPNLTWSMTQNQFISEGINRPPLSTPVQAGRYLYGNGFPAGASNHNYWVDALYEDDSPQQADTTPPAISGVNVATSGTTATITWTTDEASSSEVSYGTTASLGSSASGASGTTHSVTVNGLSSGQVYSYRVSSSDEAGNASSSPAAPAAPATFTAADSGAPVISGVTVTGTGTSRTIAWTTNESSTTSVAYGTSATDLSSTATGAAGTTHSVTLSALTPGTTYYLRVTSADPSGNSSTSPAAPANPLSFAIADTTPPVISSVAASGSGTSATVTWTTNESATTSVAYGTSATSLTSTATSAAGTSHSATLNGLVANTRYYYRVTSVDPSGNSATSPATPAAAAQYAPTVAPITAASVADFSTGTGGYIADNAGGEVMATPAAGYEFTGTTIPSGLTNTALVTSGATTVSSGSATTTGAQLATATRGDGTSMSTFAGLSAGQSIGWTQNNGATSGSRAVFVMTSTGALTAVVNDGWLNSRTIAISGTYAGAKREYRVDWNNNAATFFVDGVQKATSGFRPLVSLKAALIDPTRDATPLVSDWLRIGPYATSSTHVSRVIDAGASVGWETLTRDVTAPSATGVSIQVRSGTTATPGSGWTGWTTVSATTNSITRSARYLQYQVISTTSGTRFVSPQTKGVTLTFRVL